MDVEGSSPVFQLGFRGNISVFGLVPGDAGRCGAVTTSTDFLRVFHQFDLEHQFHQSVARYSRRIQILNDGHLCR